MSLWQALYDAQNWILREYLDDLTYSAQEENPGGQTKVGPFGKQPAVIWDYVADLRYADSH